MMRKIFICFIGIDGSGKSTLTTKIFENIRKKNKKTKKTYGRHKPIFTKLLMVIGKKLFLKNLDIYSDYDQYLEQKRKLVKKKSKLSSLYFSILVLEYYFEILFKIIMPFKLGHSVISDRYVFDTVINDLAIDSDFSITNVNQMLKKFWNFIPKPDFTFFIQISEEVAMERKNDVPNLKYLKMRNEIYKKLAIDQKMIILDGTMDISELEKRVLTEIKKFGYE